MSGTVPKVRYWMQDKSVWNSLDAAVQDTPYLICKEVHFAMNRVNLPADKRLNEELKTRTIQIRLSDEDGKIYRWTIQRVPRAVNCLIGSNRIVAGWQYTDHDGCIRFSEGTWLDLVPRVKATAENYGLKLMSALS